MQFVFVPVRDLPIHDKVNKYISCQTNAFDIKNKLSKKKRQLITFLHATPLFCLIFSRMHSDQVFLSMY